MATKRNSKKQRYHVKATKDFLVLGIIFFFLGLWAIRDGWYPSKKTLKKHPQRIEVAFDIDGTVDQVLVKEGDEIFEKQVLVTLTKKHLETELDEIVKKYTKARTKYDKARDQNLDPKKIETLKKEMNDIKVKLDTLREQISDSKVIAPKSGKILELHVTPVQLVKAGDVALVISPKDHFYPFNKALTLISFVLFFIFIFLHIFAT